MQKYEATRIENVGKASARWSDEKWKHASVAEVSRFHPATQNHYPRTEAKMVYDDAHINVIFRVQDRYVKCVRTEYHSRTHKDSCVEVYLEPHGASGYFNFEMNCGGALLLNYIEDATREGDGFAQFVEVAEADAADVSIVTSLPSIVDPEIQEPRTWTIELIIPFSLMNRYADTHVGPDTKALRGNFFKCGDETSHPHWASWAPIGTELNFHQPDTFGTIVLV